MNLKPILKTILSFFKSYRQDLQLVCEIIERLKERRHGLIETKPDELIPGRINDVERSKIRVTVIEILCRLFKKKMDKVLPDVFKELREMSGIERHEKYREIGGQLFSDLSGKDLDESTETVEDYYLRQFKRR